MSTKAKEECFIITPIGDEADPIRRHIEGIIDAAITPALGEKYEIVVAHKIGEPGSITKQIISEIYNAKLVIANITNRNPNVMYELALRHAIGKPVITIAEKGTLLPSDIVMQRAIFYQNDAKGVLELRAELEKAESEISFEKLSGPIYEVLGDISHDAQMLQNLGGDDQKQLEPLQYIIHRLDRIEERVRLVTNGRIAYSDADEFLYKKVIAFKYEELGNTCNTKILQKRLSEVYMLEPNAHIEHIAIDRNKKIINIYLIITDKISIPEVYHFFYKKLSEFGFKNITTIDSNNCIEF